MTQRQLAKTTGWSLILMAVLAGFSVGYALPFFENPASGTASSVILSNQSLYVMALAGIGFILLLDLLVSYTLYDFFKSADVRLSLTGGILRVLYTIIFALASMHLVYNLNADIINDQGVTANFLSFHETWNAGLIVFGLHLLVIGILMKKHGKIPKILYFLTLLAGLSYVLIHALKVIEPTPTYVGSLEMILALPMALGELALAIWLLIKGGKATN